MRNSLRACSFRKMLGQHAIQQVPYESCLCLICTCTLQILCLALTYCTLAVVPASSEATQLTCARVWQVHTTRPVCSNRDPSTTWGHKCLTAIPVGCTSAAKHTSGRNGGNFGIPSCGVGWTCPLPMHATPVLHVSFKSSLFIKLLPSLSFLSLLFLRPPFLFFFFPSSPLPHLLKPSLTS